MDRPYPSSCGDTAELNVNPVDTLWTVRKCLDNNHPGKPAKGRLKMPAREEMRWAQLSVR
jgi:hypothetical protein